MNIHLTGVSSLVEAEGKQKRKGSEDSKASLPLPLPLKKSASHRYRIHITAQKARASWIYPSHCLRATILYYFYKLRA